MGGWVGGSVGGWLQPPLCCMKLQARSPAHWLANGLTACVACAGNGSAAATGAVPALGEATAAVCGCAAASATPTAAPSMKGAGGATEVGGEEKGEDGAKGEVGEATPRVAAPSAPLLLRFPEPLLMGVGDALAATMMGASAGVLLCRVLASLLSVPKISWKLGRAEGFKEMQRRMTSASAGGASAGTSNGSWPARRCSRGQRRGGGGGLAHCAWGGVCMKAR